jgi:amino acid transporter
MLCIIFPVNVIILRRRKKNLNKRIKEKIFSSEIVVFALAKLVISCNERPENVGEFHLWRIFSPFIIGVQKACSAICYPITSRLLLPLLDTAEATYSTKRKQGIRGDTTKQSLIGQRVRHVYINVESTTLAIIKYHIELLPSPLDTEKSNLVQIIGNKECKYGSLNRF